MDIKTLRPISSFAWHHAKDQLYVRRNPEAITKMRHITHSWWLCNAFAVSAALSRSYGPGLSRKSITPDNRIPHTISDSNGGIGPFC